MTNRVLILHAYSAENAGDGLLVTETIDLVRAAVPRAELTMIASQPDTFESVDAEIYPAVPTRRGWNRDTRAILKQIDMFDLVVAVGGGYLRMGTAVEAAKTALVHLPQLWSASRTKAPTVYLSQSVGPARLGTRAIIQALLRRIDVVMLRDDRSVAEFGGPTSQRTPDLATARVAGGRQVGAEVLPIPVLSIRAVRGKVSPGLYELARRLGEYDGYVQSTTSGNDDRPAAATLSPRENVARGVLMTPGHRPRVVIAVRLHAALMALAAGHYVIHLAYERKGFGAFDDLGLNDWVFSVNTFDPNRVAQLAKKLLSEPGARAAYDRSILDAAMSLASSREAIVDRLRQLHSVGAKR
ncbi:MAG: hypothetical protein K0S70_692 [Microbacterium sp.]|jgi:polysaccharide pyruvyl transferase WcaK-like protein|nr:hypothetical protein [Microbacterium sp.]